ncbi:hypothetical protein BD310DRAFT_879309 [Dichomitus squalens]|uniref:Uncharacterized protein n=1 Tax=Dichomitus squalens TaxID=114155 RepID=A0A4Q9PUU4_9APHY|nr:hypothetical protein BD310DRAFT_879309 [Dichomitus squalens]
MSHRATANPVKLECNSLYISTLPLPSDVFHWALVHVDLEGVTTRHHWAATTIDPTGPEAYVEQALPNGPMSKIDNDQILAYFKISDYYHPVDVAILRDVCSSTFPASYCTAQDNRRANITCRTWITNILGQLISMNALEILKSLSRNIAPHVPIPTPPTSYSKGHMMYKYTQCDPVNPVAIRVGVVRESSEKATYVGKPTWRAHGIWLQPSVDQCCFLICPVLKSLCLSPHSKLASSVSLWGGTRLGNRLVEAKYRPATLNRRRRHASRSGVRIWFKGSTSASFSTMMPRMSLSDRLWISAGRKDGFTLYAVLPLSISQPVGTSSSFGLGLNTGESGFAMDVDDEVQISSLDDGM